MNSLSEAARDKVDKLAKDFLADTKGGTLGAVLSIQRNGKTIYEHGYGRIGPSSTVTPGPDTRFQIDSLTKVFTAIAVLKLAEEGRVDLDTGIGKYLKNQPNPAWNSITVRQYLAMVTGIHPESTTTGTYQQAIDQAAPLPLDFTPPGSKYEYSDTNYFILGNLVSKVCPQSRDADPLCSADPLCRAGAYADYTSAVILTPLGMNDTGLIWFKSGDDWATPGNGFKPRWPEAGFSGGGFVSTMRDLEKFAAAIHQRKILKPKSYQEMWTPPPLTGGKSSPFGLGWTIALDPSGNVQRASKNGGGWGWGSQLNYYPQAGESVIVLCNGSGAVGVLAGSVYSAVSGH
jgi:D-alanyl-D-alanine carboxypeptidase